MSKQRYTARVAGFINGAMRRAGEDVGELTDRGAKYLVMSGLVTPTTEKAQAPKRAEPRPTTLEKKTR